MTVLALTLAGPLQAWGSASRFVTRGTDDAPTKSGIVGLLAAARGLRRTDPLEDLVNLRFAVRIDQPGVLLRDFQTARSLDGTRTMPLSYRYYRADARYLVGLEADDSLLQGLVEALRHPVFPLYLGRRSCPPSEPLHPTLRSGDLERLLLAEPWQAAAWWRRRRPDGDTAVEFRIDQGVSKEFRDAYVDGSVVQRDDPISFDPEHRQYGWRSVEHGHLPLSGSNAPSTTPISHDALGAVVM
ncbi:MAG: type I-E CRISPR-associated protein Cas5/CasD [Micrococcales bacterium]|nr:type I-E CRISPR-associated protein Cas5/CasD [Micrococcales bacterium]